MADLNPGASFESVTIGGLDRRLNLLEADADPLVGALTLGAARTALRRALGQLAELAKLLEDPPPGAALAALSDTTPQWFLELDHDEPAGTAIRPHLPGPDGEPTGMVEMSLGLASIPLSKLLEDMDLDPLTVSDEPGYWSRIGSSDEHPEADPRRDGRPRLRVRLGGRALSAGALVGRFRSAVVVSVGSAPVRSIPASDPVEEAEDLLRVLSEPAEDGEDLLRVLSEPAEDGEDLLRVFRSPAALPGDGPLSGSASA